MAAIGLVRDLKPVPAAILAAHAARSHLMRIAVIGSGIAGLGSAWLLSREHEVVLFEENDRLGGHTDTHDVEVGGQRACRRYRLHRLQPRSTIRC